MPNRQHVHRNVQTTRTQCLTDNTHTVPHRQRVHRNVQTTRTQYLKDSTHTAPHRQRVHTNVQTTRTQCLTDSTHTVPHRQHAHNTSPLSANWHWSLVIVSVRPQIFSFFFCSSDGSASVSPANSQLSLVVLLQQASNKPNGKWWKELAFSKRVLPNRQRISKFEHFEIKIVFPRKRYIL